MTSKDFILYVKDCLNFSHDFYFRKMMGDCVFYLRGKLVGMICDERVMVKQTETSCRLLEGCELAYPYEGSKTLMFVIDDIENCELMEELFEALFVELPDSRKK